MTLNLSFQICKEVNGPIMKYTLNFLLKLYVLAFPGELAVKDLALICCGSSSTPGPGNSTFQKKKKKEEEKIFAY